MELIGPIIVNSLAVLIFILYYRKNRTKAKEAISLGVKSIRQIGPLLIIAVVLIISLQGLFSEQFIRDSITSVSGTAGVVIGALLGAIIHLPHFIAFPIGGQLLDSGVDPGIIVGFLTSIIMVHTFSIPVEIKFMGLKFALARNLLCFGFAIALGLILGALY
ncbi:MAG: permease [Nanoarchaeota archaeon]|nr:permease [Nanoarchaeota archaeon]